MPNVFEDLAGLYPSVLVVVDHVSEKHSKMLPRNLRRAVPAPSALRAAAHAQRLGHALPFRIHSALSSATVSVSSSQGFHSSAHRKNELPKSPFQTFVDVLKDELRKNRELQDNVKQLQGDVDKFQDSEAMKKAKAAYERARVRLLSLLLLQKVVSHTHSFETVDVEHKREPTVACGS